MMTTSEPLDSHLHTSTCQVLNDTDINACLTNGHGTFYDTCARKCETECTLSVLSHKHENSAVNDILIYGQIFPVLIIPVIVANVMVALVLSKRHMITPTNVVLKYMAIADLFVGLTPLPWTLYYFTLGNYQHPERVEGWWCHAQKMSMDTLPPIFHNIAMWLTVLLATQRFISISYPLYSRSICNVSNVRIATLVIAIVSFVCGAPKLFDYDVLFFDGYMVNSPNDTKATYVRSCMTKPTAIVNAIGIDIFFSVYFWTRAIVFVIFPSILLIALNAGLILGIQRAKQRKMRLLREKRSRDIQRATDSNSTSLMLVIIVTVFIIVNLPQAFFMALICIQETFSVSIPFMTGEFPLMFLLIDNMAIIATYPINFAIYCFMSSSFRQTFSSLFCRNVVVFRRPAETESSVINETKKDNSSIPLVKIMPDDSMLANDENGIIRRDRRNDSVYL